jgi:hypothetical protein
MRKNRWMMPNSNGVGSRKSFTISSEFARVTKANGIKLIIKTAIWGQNILWQTFEEIKKSPFYSIFLYILFIPPSTDVWRIEKFNVIILIIRANESFQFIQNISEFLCMPLESYILYVFNFFKYNTFHGGPTIRQQVNSSVWQFVSGQFVSDNSSVKRLEKRLSF